MRYLWITFCAMADIKNTENIAYHTVKSIGEILSYL